MSGDILIRGSWARGTDCIINVLITDVDAKSNRSTKDLAKVLAAHEATREEEMSRGLPRATSALFSVRDIYRWSR
jgi:hypothetical protein